jgi:hypothetical protein
VPLQLSEKLELGMGMEADPTTGLSEWRLDFTVTW